jgi:hypothetical protein
MDAAKRGDGSLNGVLDGLLTGQRQAVLEAFQRGGPEAGAKAYGLIRNMRANFVFDVLDKPSALRGPVLNLVPFTTWTSNQLARFVTDVGGAVRGDNSWKQPAARYVIPTLALGLFSQMTGFQMQGANPVDSAIDGATLNMGIPLVDAVGSVTKTGKVDPLLKFIPGVNTAMKTQQELRKGNRLIPALLGLKQDKRAFTEKLLPESVQKMREKAPQNAETIKKTFGQ